MLRLLQPMWLLLLLLLLLQSCSQGVRGAALLGGPNRPYPDGAYDAASARAYYIARPLTVAARAFEIGWRSARFAATLARDLYSGAGIEGPQADERGRELTDLLVELGPAFIKLGQSASVRTDLLPPPYVRALTTLQEDVPPFPSGEAHEILTSELGSQTAQSLIASLSAQPVAAASLGQVYRGSLDGAPVAVKVQRPHIVERIALDMFLVRELAAPLAARLGAPGDLVGITDAWGAGLVDELDYTREASHAARFNQGLSGTPLDGRVFAPRVLQVASSRRVLTTEWIDGERLDRTAAASDVPRLASIAMNTYMHMMLETGALHCDPHPGNLLRTSEGALCVLDWGLVTSLDAELRLTLIEHVAHIVAREYSKIPSDLVKLGFVPAGQEEAALSSGVVELLTRAYAKRAEGGGFANFDVPGLVDELRALSADAGASLFQIPPYFAYIAKAFATLEGIGLAADPAYSILNETLPYLSRRILTDPSPRTAAALGTFVFGDAKDDVAERVLDAERVGTLIDGARRYADAAATLEVDERATDAMARAERAADALLELLASDTPAAHFVTEQLVLVGGAASRREWKRWRARSGTLPLQRSVLGALVDPLGIFRASRLIHNDDRDLAALQAAEKLASLASELLAADGQSIRHESGSSISIEGAFDRSELLRALAAKVYARREGMQRVARRVAIEALDQTADRLLQPGRPREP